MKHTKKFLLSDTERGTTLAIGWEHKHLNLSPSLCFRPPVRIGTMFSIFSAEFEYMERSDLLLSFSDTIPYLKSRYGTSLIVVSVKLFVLFVLLYEVDAVPTVRLNHVRKYVLVVVLDH